MFKTFSLFFFKKCTNSTEFLEFEALYSMTCCMVVLLVFLTNILNIVSKSNLAICSFIRIFYLLFCLISDIHGCIKRHCSPHSSKINISHVFFDRYVPTKINVTNMTLYYN